ncbi:hypothetical protein J4216_03050 [Candidatus Woesearchaeota archaeon]|nr:hypothetical protein [Candidatus Woesearchaeota archaeon]
MLRKIAIAVSLIIIFGMSGYININDLPLNLDSSTITGKSINQNSEPNSETNSQPTPSKSTNIPKTNPSSKNSVPKTAPKPEIKISLEDLQKTIASTPAFKDFPEKGLAGITFFDGNGKDMPDQKFLIKGGGKVEKGDNSDADFIISTGNYWIPKVKASNDFCEILKEIKEKQDYRFKRNIGVLQAGIKYKSLIKYKDCLGL